MRPIIAGFFALLALSPVAAIIGGKDVPEGKYPYVVGIFRRDRQKWKRSNDQCTGVLIARNLVLTAANCIRRNEKHGEISIDSIYRYPTQGVRNFFEVSNYSIPKAYSWRKPGSNIALISFTGDHNITKFAKLVPNNMEPYLKTGDWVTAVGFGLTDRDGEKATVLKEAAFRTTSKNDCATATRIKGRRDIVKLLDDQFCSESCEDAQTATCEGDWGGPVIFQDYVIGIVSKGRSCRQEGCYPNVFTSLDKHLNFIKRRTPVGCQHFPAEDEAKKKAKKPYKVPKYKQRD